jgi:hypothetical protein
MPVPLPPTPDVTRGYPKTLYHVITDDPGYTAVAALNFAAFNMLLSTGEWVESADAALALGKPASQFPRLKYQWSDQPPGFTYVRLESADDEAALTGTWYDTPTAAIAAHGNTPAHPPAHNPPAAKPPEDDESTRRARR